MRQGCVRGRGPKTVLGSLNNECPPRRGLLSFASMLALCSPYLFPKYEPNAPRPAPATPPRIEPIVGPEEAVTAFERLATAPAPLVALPAIAAGLFRAETPFRAFIEFQ